MSNESLLKIISTYRSGKYAFSANFDAAEVNIPLTKARTLAQIVESMPISNILGDGFSPEGLMEDAAVAIAALDVYAHGVVKADKDARPSEEAVRGARAAYSRAFAMDPAVSLMEDAVKEIQRVLTADVKTGLNAPGEYHDPPPAPARDKTGASTAHVEVFSSARILSDVKLLMLELAAWIKRPEVVELGPEIRAALARFHLFAIRPFAIANAATATIVESMLLERAGLKYSAALLPTFYVNRADEYRDAVERTLRAREHDMTGLLTFVLNGHVEGLAGVLDSFRRSIAGVALRTRVERLKEERRITQNQRDLLSLMMAEYEPVTLRKLLRDEPYRLLYRSKSERTARRDLDRLARLKLLTLSGDGSYELNF